MEEKTGFHFQRFEFKYLLPLQKAEHIIEDCLENNLTWDPFVRGGEKRYPVTSLYFDTPSLRLYREKNAGIKERFKVRLRTYEEEWKPKNNVFFEIKRKNDAVVNKDRVVLPFEKYDDIFRNGTGFAGIRAIEGPQEIAEEILMKIRRYGLGPLVFVTYDRFPLVGKFIERFRVTFDYRIRAARFINFSTMQWFPVLEDHVIMEVKYHNTLPGWFQRIIQAHDLERVAFSKYGKSVEALHRHGRL
jgi:hypothetical protein